MPPKTTMTMTIRCTPILLSLSLILAAGAAWAGELTEVPFTFEANTRARATDVNANFDAVEVQVTDNDARIDDLIAAPAVPGPQGEQGVQGVAGIAGLRGLTGPRGAAGQQGNRGPDGIPGPRGISGPAGTVNEGDVLDLIDRTFPSKFHNVIGGIGRTNSEFSSLERLAQPGNWLGLLFRVVSHAQEQGGAREPGALGRLEVSLDGGATFGTVCDDGFTQDSARVVCKMMGWASGQVFPSAGTIDGASSQEILLDDLRCAPGAVHLLECLVRPLGSHNCRHSEDVGVDCTPF
jgi:hypothetical protein